MENFGAVALCVNATAHASKRSKHVRPRTVTMYFNWHRIGQVGPYTDLLADTRWKMFAPPAIFLPIAFSPRT